jgi:heme iron utilization protein
VSNTRQHGGAPSAARPQVPEPSLAERARTLLHVARMGTLTTLSRKHPGWPFGSLMPYAIDDRGRPVFLVSSMAMHTQNMHADARASLFVPQPGVLGDPLGAARATLMGNVVPATAGARERYLKVHENAQYWIDYEDFSLLQMNIVDVYYIGGFGVMGWVASDDYQSAAPDPLADDAPRIIEHMNADHADALRLLVREFASLDADEARMTAVDRLGFDVRLKTGDRVHGARIPFLSEVKSVEESRKMPVAMTRRATSGSPNT